MKDDIFESVSQRGSGEETAENCRIHEVADELHRRCQLYEAKLRDGQDDVNRFEVEQRVAEQYAKENGMWLPMSDIFDLGVPGPSGNENDTYVSNDIIYKVNNLLNTGSLLRLLERVTWHNNLFYDTALGFVKQNEEGRYANGDYVVWDLVPRNVLRDKDGDIFIVDAEIAKDYRTDGTH
ncbi:MAG: hypothetical protein J6T43_01645 [Prevotella sp.]|nr:hypothetical protein [Prevotella sp.]